MYFYSDQVMHFWSGVDIFYTVAGGGHAAPTPNHPERPSRLATRLLGPLCRDVESSRLAWDFMRAYQR
jgi:poly(3-hydroxybutyrate) depolymerase